MKDREGQSAEREREEQRGERWKENTFAGPGFS